MLCCDTILPKILNLESNTAVLHGKSAPRVRFTWSERVPMDLVGSYSETLSFAIAQFSFNSDRQIRAVR